VSNIVSITLGGLQCLDAANLWKEATRKGWQTAHWFGKANSFCLTRGREPGKGYFLLRKSDAVTLADSSNVSASFKIVADKPVNNDTTILTRLIVCSITALYANDPDTPSDNCPYLVEVSDRRVNFIMSKAITAPYQATTYGGVLSDLWSTFPTLISAPALPYTPTGTPPIVYLGDRTAWEAYNDILELLECTLVYNPITDAFSIVEYGAIDFSALNSRFISSYAPSSASAGNLPEKIIINFPITDSYTKGYQDYHSVSTSSGLSGAVAGTYFTIWENLEYPGTSTNIADRATQLSALAAIRLQECSKTTRRLYRGFPKTILPGTGIHSVTWRDYGDAAGPSTEFFEARQFPVSRPPYRPPQAAPPTRWKNTSASTCIPYGCIEIYGSDTDGDGDYLLGRRTTRSSDTGLARGSRTGQVYYFNKGDEVAQNAIGYCSTEFPCRAAYDPGFPTPAAMDVWGPSYGSWQLIKSYATGTAGDVTATSGFVLLGGIDDSDADFPTIFATTLDVQRFSTFHAGYECDMTSSDPISYFNFASAVAFMVDLDYNDSGNPDSGGSFIVRSPGNYLIWAAASLSHAGGADTLTGPILVNFDIVCKRSGDSWKSTSVAGTGSNDSGGMDGTVWPNNINLVKYPSGGTFSVAGAQGAETITVTQVTMTNMHFHVTSMYRIALYAGDEIALALGNTSAVNANVSGQCQVMIIALD
jgi:hypothetical protein